MVELRVQLGEALTDNSPLLIREKRSELVPMTGQFMASMDKTYASKLGWLGATIHSRRRGYATAAVRSGIHMVSICIAIRHSQGVTMQYIALSIAEKASITTRLAVSDYDEKDRVVCPTTVVVIP